MRLSKGKIDNNTTQLNDIELNFDNLEVSKTVSDIIDDSIANQKYLGGYIEIQPDSYKAVGETVLYAMLNRCKMAMTTIKVNA